ncbi:hypothetical protein CI109_101426 [Kwoniella shandongensis]|uniref:Cytochrome c oxidase assembly protein COX16, mitochondrial n=1 Tax=Kwoniella shandongensis TaxID=1734106 RepID=A0A5M6BUK5_9TREE|nr:uncharacterized protein CI109_005122 [Kwoniella shandongensis]KAA5526546.1 hypothetical protein CI109_005122 [Kwoniella shandongensis]
MPPFSSKSLSPKSPILGQIRRHPFLFFGLPFIGIIVASSFALQEFTQTRYDYQASKVKSMGVEEELGMRGDRRKVDLREEYYRLNAPDLQSPDSALDASLSSAYQNESTTNPDQTNTNTKPRRPKFSMAPVSQDDYEPLRVPRPQGMPEWGGGKGGEEAPLKGQRKTDRWV